MILLSACFPRSAALLFLVLAATNLGSIKCQTRQGLSSQAGPSGPFDMDVEEEDLDLFEQELLESSRTEEANDQPKKDKREPCAGVFISDKGNRYSDCGPWRLKKRAPPPPKGGWPGFPGLMEEAAVPKPKHDADFLGWIWVFGAWEDKLFKMVSVDIDGKKIECRYSRRTDINETFMPDILTADELQPYWDIAVREGESPDERPEPLPPPGSYIVEVDVFCKKNTHHCDETLSGRKGEGYRGCQSFTRHGEPCQKWTDQFPITHNNTPELKPGKGLGDHNFCRNPDGMQTIWCYVETQNVNADRRRADKKNPYPHRGALWEWCLPMATYVSPDQSTTTTTTVCQPLGDFTSRLVKKDHMCKARDRHFLGRFTRQRCAEAVRANGYKYFHWIKWCATGNCGAVGTKSAQCREGFWYNTKWDFYEIEELDHHKQPYVKHQLIKSGKKCNKSGEAFLGWMSSVPACANMVKSEGGNFFSYGNGNHFTAGACYKENTKSSSCPEGWMSGQFDFYALDETAEIPSHSGAECFHSQCCHSEGSAPCTWCGGEDWYCCDVKKNYTSTDKCANVEIINETKYGKRYNKYYRKSQYRCAKLKSSLQPSPRPTKPTEPPNLPTTSLAPPTAPPTAQPTAAPTTAPTAAPPAAAPPTAPSTAPPTAPPTAAPTPAPTKPQSRRRRRGKRGSKKGKSRRRRKGKASRRRSRSKKGPSRRRRRGKRSKKAASPSQV